jgi:hypothetical protein
MKLRTLNDAILEHYQTFVVTTPYHAAYLEMSPFGVPTRWTIDPTRTDSEVFGDLLQRLDSLTFGPEGMPMDKWVFYDCAELPGFIYGFATPAANLDPYEREVFGVPDGYAGPVPFSMYIAIPTCDEGTWFGHNLASLNRTFPERKLHYLGTLTKAMALKAFRVKRFLGATQWKSNALYIHTRFGPLDLFTTYTPAHSIPETLTYGFEVTDRSLLAALGDPDAKPVKPLPNVHLDADDADAMQALQREVEAGVRLQLVGPPSTLRHGKLVHPIRRVG